MHSPADSLRLSYQVLELLQVLTEAKIKETKNEKGCLHENVNLPAGTILKAVLNVVLNNVTTLGTITLGATGFGELDTQNGDVVPTVTTGNTITVMNGASAILAGAF